MKYCTVKSYMSKAGDNIIISNSHMCAERQLIKQLYRECIKEGKKPHHFTSWIRRKYGHLVIYRESVHGDMISLPCVICRKMIANGLVVRVGCVCLFRDPRISR